MTLAGGRCGPAQREITARATTFRASDDDAATALARVAPQVAG